MRHRLIVLIPSALALFDSAAVAETNKFEPLFNGKDLTGWHVKCQPGDREKVFWKVDAGSILCDSMGRKDHNYVWLLTDKEFGDFELKLRFQVYKDSPGNSGLQFRSRFDDTARGGWLDGPQVDIHPPQSMPWRTGFIYDETREERRWIFPSLKDSTMDPRFEPSKFVFKYVDDGDGWNDLVLICKGTRIKTTLNGIVRTDWDSSGVLDNAAHATHNVGRKGHFALQLHTGDELRIRFKDILLRDL
jgi:3-keto-disaccharide hydrolase